MTMMKRPTPDGWYFMLGPPPTTRHIRSCLPADGSAGDGVAALEGVEAVAARTAQPGTDAQEQEGTGDQPEFPELAQGMKPGPGEDVEKPYSAASGLW